MRDLGDHFAGDQAWNAYADAIRPALESFPRKDDLIRAVGDESVAAAVYEAAGEFSFEWLEEEFELLGGTSPLSCLATARGLRRLKTFLMRAP